MSCRPDFTLRLGEERGSGTPLTSPEQAESKKAMTSTSARNADFVFMPFS
jgi:hypothetical protein